MKMIKSQNQVNLDFSESDEQKIVISIKSSYENGSLEEYKNIVKQKIEETNQKVRDITVSNKQQILTNLDRYSNTEQQLKQLRQEVESADLKLDRIMIRNKFDNQEISKKQDNLNQVNQQKQKLRLLKQLIVDLQKCEQMLKDQQFISAARVYKKAQDLLNQYQNEYQEHIHPKILTRMGMQLTQIENRLQIMIKDWQNSHQIDIGKYYYDQLEREIEQIQNQLDINRNAINVNESMTDEYSILQSFRPKQTVYQPIQKESQLIVEYSTLK